MLLLFDGFYHIGTLWLSVRTIFKK